MFAKLTPASLCACSKMIDTQMKRDAGLTAGLPPKARDKMASKDARSGPAARVHALNARNRQDVNSNSSACDKQLNRGMSVGGARRSPRSLDVRKEEVMAIRNRFPTKVPIIVQRFCKETALPQLDKSKYLVPQEITMSQFLTIIRNRMRIGSTQTLYLLVNNRSMISLSLTLAEVYNEYAGTDGFLYVTYASQEVFGGGAARPPFGARPPPTRRILNATESHFDAFLDNTYKSMCFG